MATSPPPSGFTFSSLQMFPIAFLHLQTAARLEVFIVGGCALDRCTSYQMPCSSCSSPTQHDGRITGPSCLRATCIHEQTDGLPSGNLHNMLGLSKRGEVKSWAWSGLASTWAQMHGVLLAWARRRCKECLLSSCDYCSLHGETERPSGPFQSAAAAGVWRAPV